MLAYLFVVIAVAFRFMPSHWWSFTPLAASLLYFGSRGPRRQWWAPVMLLAAGDVVLTRVVYQYPFSADHFASWAWYAAMIWMGTKITDLKPVRLGAYSLAASVSFFVVSNFAVWVVWNMYPKTVSGLMACYAAAVPFFRNQVVADLFFTAVVFGIGALVMGTETAGEGTRA